MTSRKTPLKDSDFEPDFEMRHYCVVAEFEKIFFDECGC